VGGRARRREEQQLALSVIGYRKGPDDVVQVVRDTQNCHAVQNERRLAELARRSVRSLKAPVGCEQLLLVCV
jgi:hypothetical protein